MGSDEVSIGLDIVKIELLQGDLKTVSLLLHQGDHFVVGHQPARFEMVPFRTPLFFLGDLLGFEGAFLEQVTKVSQVVLVLGVNKAFHGRTSAASFRMIVLSSRFRTTSSMCRARRSPTDVAQLECGAPSWGAKASCPPRRRVNPKGGGILPPPHRFPQKKGSGQVSIRFNIVEIELFQGDLKTASLLLHD